MRRVMVIVIALALVASAADAQEKVKSGDLKGKRIAVTQLGSTFHYHLGNVLEKHGLTLNDVRVMPLQAMPAALEALKGKQVDAIILAQPFPSRAEADGFGKIIAWGGDL